MFRKRIGPDPHINGEETGNQTGCPDVWELEDGNFAIIGLIGNHLKPILPPTASCGDDETIIIIPRKTLIRAKHDIPEN